MLTSNHPKGPQEQQIIAIAELFRVLTPTFIALVGGIIGITALTLDGDGSAFGLAGTAIAGAAGLAQSNRSSSTQVELSPSEISDNKSSKTG